jgi:hypothetical protein
MGKWVSGRLLVGCMLSVVKQLYRLLCRPAAADQKTNIHGRHPSFLTMNYDLLKYSGDKFVNCLRTT